GNCASQHLAAGCIVQTQRSILFMMGCMSSDAMMNRPAECVLVPLRELRALAAVVRDGGIRPSTETLLRTASAVSRAIAQLEQRLGMRAFERHGRGMLPTAAGRLAYDRFCRIEQELGRVLDEAARGASMSAW